MGLAPAGAALPIPALANSKKIGIIEENIFYIFKKCDQTVRPDPSRKILPPFVRRTWKEDLTHGKK